MIAEGKKEQLKSFEQVKLRAALHEPGLNTDAGQFSVEFSLRLHEPELIEGWVDFHFPTSCAWARTLNRKKVTFKRAQVRLASVYMKKLKKFQPF